MTAQRAQDPIKEPDMGEMDVFDLNLSLRARSLDELKAAFATAAKTIEKTKTTEELNFRLCHSDTAAVSSRVIFTPTNQTALKEADRLIAKYFPDHV